MLQVIWVTGFLSKETLELLCYSKIAESNQTIYSSIHEYFHIDTIMFDTKDH